MIWADSEPAWSWPQPRYRLALSPLSWAVRSSCFSYIGPDSSAVDLYRRRFRVKIQAEQLVAGYDKLNVLTGVDIAIADGEMVGS